MSRKRSAFTLIELLIVIAIIGILVAIIAVAVTKALELGKRMTCANNLRNIGQAIITYANKEDGRLPAARIDWDGGGTWAVLLFPYLGQSGAGKSWDLRKRYYVQDPELRQMQQPLMYCPSRRRSGDNPLSVNTSEGDVPQSGWPTGNPYPGALGDYAANQGNNGEAYEATTNPTGFNGPKARGPIILADFTNTNNEISRWSSRTKLEMLEDGPANTILLGEKHILLGKLGKVREGSDYLGDGSIYNGDPGNLNAARIAGGDGIHKATPLARDVHEKLDYQFGSWHPGVVPFVFGDLSVKFIRVEIDNLNLGRMACRDDGEVISYDW